jgi:putative transcriptional regulator
MMNKTPLKVLHETIMDFHKIGLIDKATMKEFDSSCLPKVKDFSPRQIKKLRQKAGVSQPVFAKMLNISPSSVKHWETGEKHPSGIALKMLNLIAAKGIGILCIQEEARK